MTDVPGRVDVFVSTPLGNSDHCFVSCVLRVEQSMTEYNVIITAFPKYSTNLHNARSAVRSYAWNTILKSADPIVAFCRAIGEGIGRYVPATVLRS